MTPFTKTKYPGIYIYQSKHRNKLYAVKYRRANGSPSTKRGFSTIAMAREWLSKFEESKRNGAEMRPSKGRIPVRELAVKWFKAKENSLKPSAFSSLESSWDTHVAPRWADVPVGRIATADIQEWVDNITAKKRNIGQPASATVVIRCVGVLKGVLNFAVRDGCIPNNPADQEKLELPKKGKRKVESERRYLSVEEVKRLAQNVDPDRAPIIWLTAVMGLRFGEVNGVQAEDFNLARKRLHVRRSWSQDRHGKWHMGPPKNGTARTVPIPSFLVPGFQQLLADLPRGARVFTRRSGSAKPLPYPGKANGWREASWLEQGLVRAGIARLTVHDLRHTAASLSVQAGAHVVVLQRMLGHANAAETLDTYADLFDGDLDQVADCLDAVFSRP